MKLNKYFKLVYKSYIGRTMSERVAAIIELVNENGGREFFNDYSTSKDSILDFLKRFDDEGVSL